MSAKIFPETMIHCFLFLSAGILLAGCVQGPSEAIQGRQYTVVFDHNSEIYIMNSDGSGVKQLTYSDPHWSANPVWSPDRTRIAFRSYRDGDVEIYVMDEYGENLRKLTNLPQLDKQSLEWSPDGTQIAFHCDNGIYVVHADGSDQRQLTNRPGDRAPAWSPDGRRIAFHSLEELESSSWAVNVINPDGTGLQRLTPDSVNVQDPLWLPDGNTVVCLTRTEQFFDIYLVKTDGSKNISLPLDRDVVFMALSPEGTRIAFLHYVTLYVHDLYLVNIDGTGLQRLNPEGMHIDGNSSIDWTPDGTKLAFENGYTFSGHPDDYGMYFIHADGGQPRYLGKGNHPRWGLKSAIANSENRIY